MFLKLFIAFSLVPIIEIYLFIKLGSVVGAFNTILIVIATAFAGASLARLQGWKTMLRVRASLSQGIMPTEDLIDAMIIFMAGVLLLTPGLLTDCCGLLLLFPSSRRHFKRWVRRRFERWVDRQRSFPEDL